MPDPDKLLTTLRRAHQFTRATPGRKGRLVELADASDVLVAGDLHGNIANFQRLLKTANLAAHPRRHFVMQELIHGSFRYADGSDKSHQAVDLWCALKCQFPTRVHFIPGNHELAQYTNRPIAKSDLDLNANFLDGVRSAYGRHADDIYKAYLDLFRVLPVALRSPNRVFISHSLPSATTMEGFDAAALSRDDQTDADVLPGGAIFNMSWGRDVSPANVEAYLKKVDADWLVTGHIPCEKGFATPNDRQIILDSLGEPAAYCLFPASGTINHAELVASVQLL
jgi:calcineurin-like phosphoesterase family protein